MSATNRYCCLVLAGSRGPGEPLARHFGVSHKALGQVRGRAMLARVLGTLCESGFFRRVLVAIEDEADIEADSEVAAFFADGRAERVGCGSSPGDTVRLVLRDLGDEDFPMLVTTADHPLLSHEILDDFLQRQPPDADATLAVVSEDVIRARWPQARRTFYRFRREAVSGANLFVLSSRAALPLIDTWARVERQRKKPWRMVREIGMGTLAAYLSRRLTLDGALERLSRAVGAEIRAIRLPFAEAAVDVDKPADVAVVEEILSAYENA